MDNWYVIKTTFEVDGFRTWSVLIAGPMSYPEAWNKAGLLNMQSRNGRSNTSSVYHAAIKMEKE